MNGSIWVIFFYYLQANGKKKNMSKKEEIQMGCTGQNSKVAQSVSLMLETS